MTSVTSQEGVIHTVATAIVAVDRNTFEDQFPVMFQFYKERGKLSEEQHQKVEEIQSRWKAGLVFWLTSDNKVIEIPDWVAMNVVINNKTNIFRSSRICMSLNHTKGYGCNRLAEGTCSYIHECVLCGQSDHGVFQKRPNGSLICKRLRKWNDEEERFKNRHGDTHTLEDKLSDLANRGRDVPRTRSASGEGGSPTNHQQGSVPARPGVPRHPDQAAKVKTLMNTTGCTEQQALDLLVASRWNIQLAADAYFELDLKPGDGSTVAVAAGSAGGWGSAWSQGPLSHPAIPRSPEVAPQKQAAPAPKTVAATGEAPSATALGNSSPHSTEDLAPGALDLGPPWEDTTPTPPPAQPPPPRMPPNWQALWSDQHQSYYFWHVPTNKTVWEVPSLDAASPPQANDIATPTAVAPSRAVGEAVSRPNVQSSDKVFSPNGSAALSGLPGLAGIGPLCGSLGQLQLGATSGPGDVVSTSTQIIQQPIIEQRSPQTSSGTAMERLPPERLAEQPAQGGSFIEKTDAQRKAEELWSCREGHYMCMQHWWPPEGNETCMRLFHGEHVTLTWTDGKESGWAYGHIIDDSSHEGYFPQAVLKEVKRAPRRRGVGEACNIIERFEAPAGVAGYLTVSPGDVLKVLHPMEAPAVWVYVELMTRSGPEAGWVPEAVLNNAHPAG